VTCAKALLLTNGAAAREPQRISPILVKSAREAPDLGRLENSVFLPIAPIQH
jgi:hypothetical protein